MNSSTRTQQWIELAAGLTRAEFVRRHTGYFLVSSPIAATSARDPAEPPVAPRPREVRWIRKRTGAASAEARVSIGRATACDLPLVHPSIANRHAAFSLSADGRPIAVSDLGSHTGTRINGKPIPSLVRCPLDAGDRLQLGDVSVTIVAAERAWELLVEMAPS